MGFIDKWRIPRTPFHRAYPSPTADMVFSVNINTAVDRERGFIYFRIPKAANSTVVRNLVKGDVKGPSKNAKRAFDRVDTLTRDEVASLASRFFLFTVVRNPYSRIASAYLDKVVRGKRSAKVLRKLGKHAGDDVSFLEFCHYLLAGGVNEDQHWYRQVHLIPCGIELLHYVGRVESLMTDLDAILIRINGTASQGHQSWAPHRTGADTRLGGLYCPESIRIVRSVYAEDFEILEYSEEAFWL